MYRYILSRLQAAAEWLADWFKTHGGHNGHEASMSDGGTTLDPNFEKFAGPLGHLILEFNYLEVDTGRMLARLLDQDDATAAVFAAMIEYMQKLKLMQALVALKIDDDALKAELNKLVDDATKVNAKRNQFVHAEYMPVVGPDDELMKMLYRRLKDLHKTASTSKGQTIHDLLHPLNKEELEAAATEAHQVAFRMRAAAEKVYDRPRPGRPRNAS
jgi:hypothetical protein